MDINENYFANEFTMFRKINECFPKNKNKEKRVREICVNLLKRRKLFSDNFHFKATRFIIISLRIVLICTLQIDVSEIQTHKCLKISFSHKCV